MSENILLIAAGALVGLVATLFAVYCNKAEQLFLSVIHHEAYLSLVIMPFSFALLFYIAHQFFPGTKGSGIPQAIAALNSPDESGRERFLSLRILIAKFFLTLGAFLCGASVGREGPTVLIGSSIMYLLKKTRLPRFQYDYVKRGLIIAGGAAGIAAAFYTPLAGIVFAIEEHSKSYEIKLTKILMLCIMVSGFVCVFYFQSKQYFSNSYGTLITLTDWLSIPVCGIFGGLCGALFSFLLLKLNGQLAKFSFKHRLLLAFACGLVVAIIGIISSSKTYGSSYIEANQLIVGTATIGASFGLLKFLATLITYLSGISGGILAPTLATGAGLGVFITHIFSHTSHSAIIILAMVSYFAGVMRSPITSFVIVLEMTGRYDLVIPIMAAAVIAEYVASLINKVPLYEALAESLLSTTPTKVS